MPNLEKTLIEVTGIKPPKSGEDRQKFLLRAMLAVQKLPSDDWEGLDQSLQDWYNDAVAADNANKAVPELPGVAKAEPDDEPEEDEGADADDVDDEDEDDGDEDAADDSDSEEQEEDVKPSKSAKSKSAGKTAPKTSTKSAGKTAPKTSTKSAAKSTPAKSAPAAKKPAAKAASSPKGKSMRRALKEIVIKKPKISAEDLIGQLEKKGFKSPSKLTVTSIRADTRDTIKVLNEAGITQIEL